MSHNAASLEHLAIAAHLQLVNFLPKPFLVQHVFQGVLVCSMA